MKILLNFYVTLFTRQQYLDFNLQLGQPSVIPPGLVLEVGGTSTLFKSGGLVLA